MSVSLEFNRNFDCAFNEYTFHLLPVPSLLSKRIAEKSENFNLALRRSLSVSRFTFQSFFSYYAHTASNSRLPHNMGFNLTSALASAKITAGENAYRILWVQRCRCRLNAGPLWALRFRQYLLKQKL